MGALSSRRWGQLWLPLVCGLLALAVRLPVGPEPESAAPWFRGSLALQGLRVATDSGPLHRDLAVAVPLAVAQNAGYLASRAAGRQTDLSRVAWVRGNERFARTFLWGLWTLAAVLAAGLATRLRPGWWGLLAGLAVAVVPIGIAGTERLEGWALAAPLALATVSVRRGVGAVVLWGLLFSLSPLGLLLGIIGLLCGERSVRQVILLALPVWFALDPSRIVSPGAAIAGLPDGLRAAGWPGVGAGPVLALLHASWTPGIVAAVLAGVGMIATRMARPYRVAAIGLVLLWWLPAAAGAVRPDAVGLLAPLSLVLAVRGAEEIVRRAARGRVVLGAGLSFLLLAPILLGSLALRDTAAEQRQRAGNLAALLAREVGSTGLLVRDPSTPVTADSIPSFPFPTHVERPEVWDFAYWPGWYGSFTHMLFRARSLRQLEKDATVRPGARSLLLGLAKHADAVAALGDPVTEGSALVLYRLRRGPPWEPENRQRLWDELQGGASEAGFLGNLAAFLADRGQLERAIELLRVGLRWDPDAPRLWNNLGATLLMLGEAEEAARVLTRGLERNPSSVEIRHTLARAYLEGGLPGRAVVELRKVLAARPNSGRAHYDMARAAAALKRWPLALQALEAYLATEPNPPNREQVVAALEEARRLAEAQR